MTIFKKITFSTYLTLVRLIGAPFMVPFLIVHYAIYNNFIINILIATIFLLFGFTDFLDGFFARRYAQVTKIGASLDHLADKFLMLSGCIGLLAIGKISYQWVIILLGREFFVMGMRQIALENNMQISVSSYGKIKTALHIILITWIIINPMHGQESYFWNGTEFFLLITSTIISLWSAADYGRNFFSRINMR